MTIDDALRRAAERWMSDDPDPDTRAEVDALLHSLQGGADLADRFAQRLEFGTAGLRGVIGAGPNRMNLKVVRETTAGLCAYLMATTENARERGIAIGRDGRRMSPEFADEVAEVALGAGFRVLMFDRPTPTPMLGFVVKTERCAAGVMITASHNPPEYNGYKVYWGNGAQIIPPHDQGIAREIEQVPPALKIPRKTPAQSDGRLRILGDREIDRYHAAIAGLVVHPKGPRDLVIAYTALHGVGDVPTRRALAEAGFTQVRSAQAQAKPDGAFPTVRFPNPEEKGAMDLVLALARETKADLVIANDPDADRLAIAVPRGDGGYQQLTGNDVGCLLAHYLLSEGDPSGERAVLSSIVSSPMLGAIARAHGAYWEETLTGFKWIANRAMDLEAQGKRFVMGYEEALGYTIADVVRDKDGVSAALVFADLAAWCRSRGTTVLGEMDAMARRYGLYLSRQVSVTMKGQDGAAQIAQIMSAVRAAPPSALAGKEVDAILDLEARARIRGETREPLALPSSNALALELEGGHRVMLRPSGTEPKIKYYFDVVERVKEGESVEAARARGEKELSALVEAFVAMVGEKVGSA
ncbi:MAG: phospho-sugar mutase [Sandaracinus sp.]